MKLSKKQQERFGSLEPEMDLVDDCRYILTLKDGWVFFDGGNTMPVKSQREAKEWLNEARKEG